MMKQNKYNIPINKNPFEPIKSCIVNYDYSNIYNISKIKYRRIKWKIYGIHIDIYKLNQ